MEVMNGLLTMVSRKGQPHEQSFFLQRVTEPQGRKSIDACVSKEQSESPPQGGIENTVFINLRNV